MAVVVATDLTMISSCDSTTAGGTWSAGTVDSDAKVEGAACLYVKYTSSGAKSVTFTPTTALSLAATCVYFWVSWAAKSMPNTKALGGLAVRFESSATDYAEWNVAGNDTLPHNGWVAHIVKTDTTPTTSGGSINWGAVNKITLKFNLLVKGNVSWDVWRYGTTMSIKGGESGAAASLADFVTADVNNGYGLISLSEGVYFLQGKFKIGSGTPGEATYFAESSKVCTFTNKDVGAAHFSIEVVGNSGATTKVYFGAKSGTAGVSGCVFKPAGAAKYTFTATDANITDLGLYGCTFIDAATISLPAYSATREVLNCSFEACAEVLADTCTMTNCNFVLADNRGVRMTGTGHKITKCNFIDCGHGVHCNFSNNDPGVNFNDLVFSGSNGTTKWDIEHSAAGAHKINNIGTSNANQAYVEETGGGSTTVATSVPLKITVLEQDGDAINLAQVAIYRTSDNLQLLNGDTNAQGIIEGTYTQSTPASVYFRVRKSSGGATKYIPVSGIGTIVAVSGLSATITLYADPNA